MLRRNLFTGEWEEIPSSGEGRQVIARTRIPEGAVTHKTGSVWGTAWKSLAKGCSIEEMDERNRTAEPGARYVPSERYPGLCELHCDSRRARANELGQRGEVDFDGGYGDMARTSKRRRRAASKLRVVDGSEPATPTWQTIRDHFAPREAFGTHGPTCWKWHSECVAAILIEEIERLRKYAAHQCGLLGQFDEKVRQLEDELANTRNERDCAENYDPTRPFSTGS